MGLWYPLPLYTGEGACQKSLVVLVLVLLLRMPCRSGATLHAGGWSITFGLMQLPPNASFSEL